MVPIQAFASGSAWPLAFTRPAGPYTRSANGSPTQQAQHGFGEALTDKNDAAVDRIQMLTLMRDGSELLPRSCESRTLH